MGARLGGGSRGGRRSSNVMADINVTPMVDVMLVLLVIFMITAPLLTAGVEVNLPKEKTDSISQQDDKPLEIAIDKRGSIFMGEEEVTQEQMFAKLEALLVDGNASEQRIYIRADTGLDYGVVMSVMSAVHRSGFHRIALVTDPTGGK